MEKELEVKQRRGLGGGDADVEDSPTNNDKPPSRHLDYRHKAQSFIDGKALDELEAEVFETGLYENQDLTRGSKLSVMAAEIVYSYLWWSVFHSLPAVLWFYPLCAMEVSGFEVIAVMWLSPVVMAVGPIRRFLTSPLGLMLMRLGTMVGVASYQAPSTLSRLLVLGVGNMFAVLVLAGTWWGKSKLDRHRHIYLHMLGYLLFLAIRVWGSTFNFIFMSHTYNNLATVAGVLLSIYLYKNDYPTPVTTPTPLSSPAKSSSSSSSSSRTQYPGVVSMGIGLGGLIYLTHMIYGEVSVVTRWAVAPYPDHGPYPHPWGMVTMFAVTVGVVVFGHQTDLLTSWRWTAVGLVFAMVLYFMSTYMAFFAGTVLAIYTMSLWPVMAKRVTNLPPHKVIPLAMLVNVFFLLLSVWIVAYNFVPGGVITRERMDVMLVMLVLSCGLGSRNVATPSSSAEDGSGGETYKRQALRKKKQQQRRKSRINFLGRVIRRLSTVTEEGEGDEVEWGSDSESSETHRVLSMQVSTAEDREAQVFHGKVLKVSLVIVLLAFLGFAYRIQPPIPLPAKERHDVISGAIWAFHFGYDNNGWPSMERASQLIENSEVDVIGLLETDAARPYIGNHDIASWLSERLRMFVDYGPGPKDHTWGNLVLSKYPILKTEHFLLPSPEGEIAPAILATINVTGSIINFYIVHFGNEGDELDRKLQAERTAEILAGSAHPVVMLSYITNPPGSRDYWKIINGGNVKDIDPDDKKRWCEYIFYRGLVKLGYARISHGGLSDTEVQVGKFLIPKDPDQQDNLEMTQDPEKVPEWVHFPKMFGKLFRGHYGDQSRHHFHMNTPKYFQQAA